MDWRNISKEEDLSISFMKEHGNLLDWKYISEHRFLPHSFLREVANHIDWSIFCEYNPHITPQTIEEFQTYIDWKTLSVNGSLKREIVLKFQEKLDWNLLCLFNLSLYQEVKEIADQYMNWYLLPSYALAHGKFSDEFFICYQDKINWNIFFQEKYYPLTPSLLEAIHESINWEQISYLPLSREQLEVCQDFLNWDTIALNEWIPEHLFANFIERIHIPFLLEYRQVTVFLLQWLQSCDRLDWKVAARYQNLPYTFIKKHIEQIDLKLLFQNQSISLTEEEKTELIHLKKKPFFKKFKSMFSSYT